MKQLNLRMTHTSRTKEHSVYFVGFNSFWGSASINSRTTVVVTFAVTLAITLAVAVLFSKEIKTAQAQTPNGSKTFIVNQNTDSIDAHLGDGMCDVDPATDGDQCSLRAAILESNDHPGADTIQLPAAVIQLTMPGNEEDEAQTGDLDILDDVTIIGAGTETTTIDGGLLDRVFDIRSNITQSTTVTISELTISNGQATSGKPFNGKSSCTIIPDCGGAIRVSGRLIMTNVATVLNGTFRGGGIAVLPNSVLEMSGGRSNENYGAEGGGIYSEGSITLDGVTLSTNDSAIGGGLLVDRSGTATLTQTIIEYNKASQGAGIALTGESSSMRIVESSLIGNESAKNGGGIYNEAHLEVERVLFDFNYAGNFGGALYSKKSSENIDSDSSLMIADSLFEYNEAVSGGGIAVEGDQFTIKSSTLHTNAATIKECGGILILGTMSNSATSKIINTTVASNSGGICHYGSPVEVNHATIANNNFGGITLKTNQASQLSVKNSIITDNKSVDCDSEVTSEPLPWDETLIGTPGNCFFSGSRIWSGVNARLGVLQNNGGLTPTMQPQPGSPAIDRIESDTLCEATDQTGNVRPQDGDRDGNAKCDLGAVEIKSSAPTEFYLYLPLVTKPYQASWRQLSGSGQRISVMAFEFLPNQGVNMWVGDTRPLDEGGGLYSAPLPSDCKNMSSFVRKEDRFRILDLLFSGETAIGATYGNKIIFLDRASNTWLETPSDTNPYVYSIVQSADGAFYAGTDEGVYKSNNGTEWTSINGPSNINTLEMEGTALWIGTAGEGVQKLDLTTNRMLPIANIGLQRKALEIWDILIAESELYVATSDGVYRQKSDGSWEASGLQGIPVNTLERVGTKQFAGTRQQSAWVRMSGASSWVPVNSGVDWNPDMTIQKLFYQKDLCGDRLFAGTENGVWILEEK